MLLKILKTFMIVTFLLAILTSRTCDNDPSTMNSDQNDTIKSFLDSPLNLTVLNLAKAPIKERINCQEGDRRMNIDPEENCKHKFQLKRKSENENATIKLFMQDNEKYFDESKFCISWNNNGHLTAEVCMKKDLRDNEKDKFK